MVPGRPGRAAVLRASCAWHTRCVDPNHYRFRTCWRLTVPADDAYSALEDVRQYPRWWPEVTLGQQIDDESCEMCVRSVLPYSLSFVIRQARRDPVGRFLEATMSGDLEGFSRWTVMAAPSGSMAVFEENVVARKPLLRRLAVVGRPAFRANHALMMRSGKRGLDALLSSADCRHPHDLDSDLGRLTGHLQADGRLRHADHDPLSVRRTPRNGPGHGAREGQAVLG
jgi:hypothetical protein